MPEASPEASPAHPAQADRPAAASGGIDLSPPTHDRVATTTCYMCACRCGIRVHLKDGRIRYIEGNPDHPINHGVLCGKGSAGIMTQYSPARLRNPLLRVGERGAGDFREISWEEALSLATSWLGAIRARDPRQLAFFTGRDQSQSLTGYWAAEFGTPNFAAHGGFCSVNMAAAGLYSVGGSFWEFGEPDWEHARLFLLWGVAEDHDSNPIKLGLARLRARGARIVAINPVRTGYGAIADEWIAIRPGTDGLLALSLIHELLAADRIDLEFLASHANAHWLVIEAPGSADHGLFARDAAGDPLAWDRAEGPVPAGRAGISPVLAGTVTLPDGRSARPVFHLLAERYLAPEYAPEAVAPRCGIAPETIRRLAAELAEVAFTDPPILAVPWTDTEGRRHETMEGRPVAMHAMRGIAAHANGFHTCRAIHLLQMLLGAIDRPGAWRYKSPFPRPIPPGPAPAGAKVAPNTPIGGTLLGFPQGPDDLLVDETGEALRIDKGFSWEAPLSLHGLMHMALPNAGAGDPYRIDTLLLYMANMAWNSAMNPGENIAALTARDSETGDYAIPHVIYADAFFSETVPYADLILPDTTYLERFDCISLLDRPIGSAHGPADAIRQPVLAPDRNVRPFQEVLIELGARLGLPAFTTAEGTARYRDYPDYMINHQRRPGVGPLAGWRGEAGDKIGQGAPNPRQIERYIENGCFWRHELAPEQLYFKFANRDYLAGAVAMGLIGKVERIVLQPYAEPLQRFRLAAAGHGSRQPPERLRARVARFCDPLPFWYAPPGAAEIGPGAAATGEDFPLSAITQRPMAMYHSWGAQNTWLRQIMAENRLMMGRATARRLGLAEGDWVKVTSPTGTLRCQLGLMEGVNPDTVWTWNAIGKRGGAWNLAPDAPEATRGFLLNHVISAFLAPESGHATSNSDPVTGQAAWFDLRVRVAACAPGEAPETAPRLAPLQRPAGLAAAPAIVRHHARGAA